MVRVMLAETPRRLTRISRTLRAVALARTACAVRKVAQLTRAKFSDGMIPMATLRTIHTWTSLMELRLVQALHLMLQREGTLRTSPIQQPKLARLRTVLSRKASQCMTRTIRTVRPQVLVR